MPAGIYPRTEKHLKLLAEARKKITPEIRKKQGLSNRGRIPPNKGKKCPNQSQVISEEHKEKLRIFHTGRRHTEETKEKIRQFNLGKTRPLCRGELHPFWKGGVTPIYKKIRKSPQYITWRTAVFERDNYTCIHCGQKGGVLNADHIKPFSQYPELRFDLNNGRTLCEPCHRKTDTWGGNSKKKKICK